MGKSTPLFPRHKRSPNGSRRPQVAFRPPPDLYAYIEACVAAGYSKTEAMIRIVELARHVDAMARAGDVDAKELIEKAVGGEP